MEIEYIYPNNQPNKPHKNDDVLGCLALLCVLFVSAMVVLWLLPIMLFILGWTILGIAVFYIYQCYIKDFVMNIMDNIRRR